MAEGAAGPPQFLGGWAGGAPGPRFALAFCTKRWEGVVVWGVFVCFFGLRFGYFFFFLKRRAAAALGAGRERGHPPRSPRVRGAPGDPRPSPGPAPPRCPRGGSGRGSLPSSTEGGRGGSRRVEPRRRCRSAAGSRSPGPGRVGADPHQPPPPPSAPAAPWQTRLGGRSPGPGPLLRPPGSREHPGPQPGEPGTAGTRHSAKDKRDS